MSSLDTHVSIRDVSRGDGGGRTYVVGSAIAILVEARAKNGLPPQLRAIHSDWLTTFKKFSCPILIGCRQTLGFGLNPSVFGSALTIRNDNRQGISISYKVLQCTKMGIGLACWFSAPWDFFENFFKTPSDATFGQPAGAAQTTFYDFLWRLRTSAVKDNAYGYCCDYLLCKKL